MTPDTECSHCGLPVGRRPVRATVGGEAGRFCCWGCLLAMQVTRARGEEGAAASLVVRLGLGVFFAMNVMMLSLPTWVPYVYGAEAGPGDGPLFTLLRVLALVLAAPVLVLLGWPILAGAWRGLGAGAANADALVLLGVLAAYGLSVANTIQGRPDVYFDTAVVLLVLVTLGRWLEASAKAEAGAAVRASLAPLPREAVLLRDGVRERVVPDALRPGDVVEVGPGGAFPTDGVVLAGEAGVDEAALTGESRPVAKAPGSAVAGGTVSLDGVLRVRVTVPASASAAARITALLAEARRARGAAERLADRVAARLVPGVVLVALAAAAWWTWDAGVERGVLVGLAVLVVACPCAFGLATPVAVWTGLAAAARRGVVVRNAEALERAAHVERVLFDKTGTLTDRAPRLVAVEPAPGGNLDAAGVLARAAALDAGLGHPLATAIREAARDLPRLAAADVRAVPGRGVRGTVSGERLSLGSARLAAEELGRAVDADGVLLVGDGRLLGTLRFEEAARAGAGAAVAALRRLGIRVGLLSGDARAAAVVPALVAPGDASLGLLPEEKAARVRALAARGAVAMVGDGINDAPALAAADLGVAVARAADLARLAADVVILGDDLERIPWLLAHARRVARIVRQNLVWAFGYNTGAVGLAAVGALNPVVAALAMLGSSLTVVTNARRLAR